MCADPGSKFQILGEGIASLMPFRASAKFIVERGLENLGFQRFEGVSDRFFVSLRLHLNEFQSCSKIRQGGVDCPCLPLGIQLSGFRLENVMHDKGWGEGA